MVAPTLHLGGNVGIGTADRRAKLDVSGSGGTYQCCAPVAPTLSLSEGSNTANRQAWLQFHNWGEAEASIRLAGGPTGSGREGWRRLEVGDSQGARTSLDVRGGIFAGNSDIYFTERNHDHTGIEDTFIRNPIRPPHR